MAATLGFGLDMKSLRQLIHIPEVFRIMKNKLLLSLRRKESLFKQWCSSQTVETKIQLQLLFLEKFRNCVIKMGDIYLSEQRVSTVKEATMLADG